MYTFMFVYIHCIHKIKSGLCRKTKAKLSSAIFLGKLPNTQTNLIMCKGNPTMPTNSLPSENRSRPKYFDNASVMNVTMEHGVNHLSPIRYPVHSHTRTSKLGLDET